MSLTHIILLAVIQGLAELLPVSSSAHVIAVAKLLHQDPTTPQFTWLLVMLHTGTMFAVIVYFWRAWKRTFFHSQSEFIRFATKIVIATGITGIIGYGVKYGIEKVFLDPGYTVLVTDGLVERGATSAAPTPDSLLTRLAKVQSPQTPAFTAGDTLTLKGKKGGEDLLARSFTVTSASTVGDLMSFFKKTLGITDAAPARPKAPSPGVTFRPDPAAPRAMDIQIVGNEGHDHRLKFASDAFANQNGSAVLDFDDANKAEVEQLFKHMDILAIALAAAGVLILYSGIVSGTQRRSPRKGITTGDSVAIGAIQGLCIPFRGFSRSGATISVGLLRGVARFRLEEFSFALAVVLTPAAIGWEAIRMVRHQHGVKLHDFTPGLQGMGFSFLAGLVALKVLSKLLEKGQWWLFGVYCLAAAGGVYWMHLHHYGN